MSTGATAAPQRTTSPQEAVVIEAEGEDWPAATAALKAQVPEGHQLLHIVVGGRA